MSGRRVGIYNINPDGSTAGFGMVDIGAAHYIHDWTMTERKLTTQKAIAEAIFTRYVFTFEIVSIVLIAAAVGAMALTHRERLTPRTPHQQLSVERVRSEHPTPYPSPGVYAQHNAVDTPALLPDGTASEGSVPEELRRRGTVRYTELEAARDLEQDEGDDR